MGGLAQRRRTADSEAGRRARALVAAVAGLLLPRCCLACARPCAAPAVLGLCSLCADLLVASGEPACSGCCERLPEGMAPGLCGACLRHPPPWSRLHVGWLYRPPLDQVVRAIKFGRLEFLADELGDRLADRFRPLLARADLLVPVPLHWSRRLRRGFDQAATMTRAIGRAAGVPVVAALKRPRATRPQARRPRSRRLQRMDTAFACVRPEAVRGRHVVLVDDVVTTAATLTAAARELARHRPATLIALAAARTPRDPGPGVRGPASGFSVRADLV